LLDLLLTGGYVIDGTGRPAFPANVGVADGKIALVAPPTVPPPAAARTADCSNLALSPGFIDIHSHSDYLLLANRTAESKITQGVTTEIGGNCGFSPAPVLGANMEEDYGRYLSDLGIEDRWNDLAGFYDVLERTGIAVNFASFTGHNNLRKAVVGYEARPAAPEEMARMKRLLAEAVEQGSLGMSAGLIYPPGCYAPREELIELTEESARRGGFYATHMRDEGNHLEEAVEETLEIGRRSGSQVQISHHKACGHANWGKVERTLAMMDRAVEEGLPVYADQYPYLATSTGLAALLPRWVHDGGKEAVIGRLKDPEISAKIREEVETGPTAIRHGGRWESILITQVRTDENRWTEGLSMTQIAERWSSDPISALFRLLIEEELGAGMVNFMMCEEDVERVMKHPRVCFGSDGTAKAMSGPLSAGKPHPRAFGTFPRVLSHYVRERGAIGLEEAIRKMTGLTAQILGFGDRGKIEEGYAADLVVFDPSRVRDCATYARPHAFSEGIRHVFVNGEAVLLNSEITGATPGRTLRRR
jgi:N-acyl-D-amino-acid deacylase